MAALSSLGSFKNTGLLIMRTGLGFFMILHGYPKLIGGPDRWERVGKAMTNVGVDFFQVFWGFMAAGTETIGGFLLIIGLFFRPASALLCFVMVIATLNHLGKGDTLLKASHSAELAFVFLGLIFLGAGKYSVDRS